MSVSNEKYISEYLNRLDYHGDTTPSAELLAELQLRHVCRIIFENLALLEENYTPNLDRDYLFDQIVTRGRGGVCYELNTSFYQLLTALGFSCDQIAGSVKPGENMFSHVATLVHLPEGDYIADVGFADSFLPVLKVGCTPAAVYNDMEFRVTDQGNNVVLITRHVPGQDVKRMYEVSLTPRQQSDYFGQFFWASAKGNTVFSKYPICFCYSPEQSVLLRGSKLTVERNGQIVESRPITSVEDSSRCLREYFNLP